MPHLKGVLLDVDGTLIDSNDEHARSWVKALAEHGYDLPFERVRRLIGKGSDKLLPEVTGLPNESKELAAIRKCRESIFHEEFLPKLRPFPRVKDLLARMKQDGLKLVVASSATDDELDNLLRIAEAKEFVEASTSSDDADRSKPDPDIVEAALKRLGCTPSAAIMLGDTPYDVEAAGRARVPVVALRCGGWKDAELAHAVAIYNDPADLLAHYDASPFHHSV